MAKIVVIDDSLTARMSLREILEGAGHEAVLCADAATARAAVAAGADLILLDIPMPDGSGIQFVREIRINPATARLPILLLCEQLDSPACQEVAADVQGQIEKPCDAPELLALVDRILRAPGADATTILAVDDSPTYLHALQEQLGGDGHRVLLARGADDALKALEGSSVDCILMDLTMPGISGTDLCRRIKSDPRWRDLPVLMLTAREDREAMISSFNAGADDFISKSSEQEVLKARLRVHLRRRRSDREAVRMREQLHHKEIEAAEARAQRQLAETRAALLADLEHKNLELHRSQDDLRRARDIAESANRAKDRFLAVLSHELRTPLTPVLAMVSMVESRPDLPPELREEIATIRRNVEMEARLIDDLLDLTKIARGKLLIEQQPVDLRIVLREALAICRADIATRHLSVEQRLDAANTIVRGDPARLQQVFWNILKNAIKFTHPGGRIEIVLGNDEAGRIVTRIVDTGVGINPDLLSRIFDAFEQGERTVTRRFGGLGLGLAISKALVEMHGGRIEAHSDGEGKGATFTVILNPDPSRAAIPSPAQAGPAQRRSLKILLVEDHPDTLRILSRLLRKSGHVVEPASSVAEALERARRERFDLLLSDIGLPDGSGHDLVRQIKQLYDVPSIALSGFGMDDDLNRSREAGFDHHLTKPVSLQALESVIQEISSRAN